jgi:hypothetical protein
MNRVHRTALAELNSALSRQTNPPKLELGIATEVEAIQCLISEGLLSASILDPRQDTYAVRFLENKLHVLGSNPRGLLPAVFALHESLALDQGSIEDLNLHGTFHFNERIFHARFDSWPGSRADVRYMAHLGATHCLVDHDWQGSRRSLQGYVTSPIFPMAVDPVEVATNHLGLRRLLDDCADFGLGAMLWLTELPCQGGPWLSDEERQRFITRYDPEVLSDSGTYEGKVVCFSHPRVQEFYRDLLGRFFRDFPDIETIFLFGLDSGGEFCDPQTCPRCRNMDHFAQRDRLIRFLIAEGRKVRPDLRVLTTGWKWDRDSEGFLQHQRKLPAASGVYLAAEKDGWQCERQSHDFLREARRVCRERGQTFIGYDNFHWGDDTVHGIGDIQDFPLGIGAKIKRWHKLDAHGVFDHWGHTPEDVWCNSIACRDFFLNPLADPTIVARQIALRQFGADTGAEVMLAWATLEQAHVELSPACIWSPGQWLGWYAGRKHWPLPGHFRDESLRVNQASPRREGNRHYNPSNFGDALQAVADAWGAALPHYEKTAGTCGRRWHWPTMDRPFITFGGTAPRRRRPSANICDVNSYTSKAWRRRVEKSACTLDCTRSGKTASKTPPPTGSEQSICFAPTSPPAALPRIFLVHSANPRTGARCMRPRRRQLRIT